MTKQLIINNGGFNDRKQPHFVLVPYLFPGHMIPMLDMARLIADRGPLVSFITTPGNAARVRPAIDRAQAAGSPIRFVELDFPSADAGFPQGCESGDLLPLHLMVPFMKAVSLLRRPLELYLQAVEPVPSCMIVDYCNSWTAEVSHKLSIPRIIFHGSSCFYLLCNHNILKHNVFDGLDLFEPANVPDLGHKIEVARAQAPGWLAGPELADLRYMSMEAEASAEGVVVNTFMELETEIVQRYTEATGKRVWPIGPVSLRNKDVTSKATRGNKTAVDGHQVLSWLDSKELKSVMYVNFGSLVRNRASQLIEIGCGLEASKKPFIWVMKEDERCPQIEQWMAGGFEERTKERSLVITGWAPQVLIISHPSVGGFLTHCGWNSTLEAVSAGVPMITCPYFSDQFLNEKLIVEVLKIGVSIGIKKPIQYVEEDEVLVKREEVERAIASLMDGGEVGERRRERAAKLGLKAATAMEEQGSSYENLTLFIEYISKARN